MCQSGDMAWLAYVLGVDLLLAAELPRSLSFPGILPQLLCVFSLRPVEVDLLNHFIETPSSGPRQVGGHPASQVM